jgi:predicted MPP superfamily phosphohydrolase
MITTRRRFLGRLVKLVTGSALMAASGGYGGYRYATRFETEWLDVEQVQIPLKNLNTRLEGFKIVQLSDLHLRPFTTIDLINKAVAMVNDLRPDLVVLTGDFVLRDVEAIFELAPALAALNPTYGIYAIFGNHDLWTNHEVVRAGLAEQGIPILENAGRAIGVGQTQIYIAGVDDAWSGRPDLAAALAAAPDEVPIILLAHEPDLVDRFAVDGRVSLQLSGHTHGGQVRLPGIGPLVLPYLGKKYDLGLYRVSDTWLYTNRGLGVIWPPVRFNCRPEITEINLVRA